MSDHSGGLGLGRVLLDRRVSGHHTWAHRGRDGEECIGCLYRKSNSNSLVV